MRKRNASQASAVNKAKKTVVKLIAALLVIALAGYAIGVYLGRFLMTSDYFKIKNIVSRQATQFDLSYLIGRNIFSLDLKKEARYLLANYPIYKRIRFVRVLPERLFVDYIQRQPVGIVKLYRYFYVDEDGVLFDIPQDMKEFPLPLITGLETKIFGPKPGFGYNNIKELNLALGIIQGAQRNKVLRGFQIKRIDVANITNASIFINIPVPKINLADKNIQPGGGILLEIKVNSDKVKEKVSIISDVLVQAEKDLANIKYIDVRFKEPVIKLK